MALSKMDCSEFDHEMGTTHKLLMRVPEDKLAWKPHAKSMSLGGLATHVANIPMWGARILNATFYDLAAAPAPLSEPTSRAAVLERFEESTKQARAALAKTDAELTAQWSLKRGDQEVYSIPRVAAFRSFVLSHMIHHRGQLSVYLRLNDVPLPAMYGPTADEG